MVQQLFLRNEGEKEVVIPQFRGNTKIALKKKIKLTAFPVKRNQRKCIACQVHTTRSDLKDKLLFRLEGKDTV